MIKKVSLALLLCASTGSNIAVAHDIWAVANPHLLKEGDLTEADLKAAYLQQTDENSRYVIERTALWIPGQTLRMCFIGGSAEDQEKVKSAATELFSQSHMNLKLDIRGQCKKGPNNRYSEEFRVSLQDNCCSAYVGRTSLVGAVAKGPNIFIQGPPASYIVKHELVHALGFHHEHQKPTSPCEFNYDLIASTYGWSKDEVINNFQRLNNNSNKYIWDVGFDVESDMKYFFNPEFLVGGTSSPCYYPQVMDLSAKDIAGLQRAYPQVFSLAEHRTKIANKAAIPLPANSPLKNLISAFPSD